MLLGPPGVGKGTYASGASRVLHVPHLAAGDVIRKEIKEGTPLGIQMQEYTKQGALVPDELVTEMMINAVRGQTHPGILLDGFPRTLRQAEMFQESGVHLDAVINLQQSEDIILTKITNRRLCSECGEVYNLAHIKQDGIDMPPMLPKVDGICDNCGAKDSLVQRDDDKEETVRRRLRIYAEETQPLIEFYRRLGILKDFVVCGGAEELLPSFVKLLLQEGEGEKGENAAEGVMH